VRPTTKQSSTLSVVRTFGIPVTNKLSNNKKKQNFQVDKMSSMSEFGLNLTFEEMSAIAETQVADPNSQISMNLMNAVAKAFNTQLLLNEENERRNGKKTRIYMPFHLEGQQKFELGRIYGDFEIVLASPDRVAAALARASAVCVVESMLHMAPHREREVVLYGGALRTVVMRNRKWLHLCLSASDPVFFADFYREDQALSNIYMAMDKGPRKMPPLLDDYMNARFVPACMHAESCTREARVSIALLDRIDTNFRQLCMFMDQHNTELLFFAIPGHKNMEERVEGAFDELGGYIAHRGDTIHVIFPGEVTYQYAYNHYNYMELVARTRVIHQGNTYVKEFVARRGGHVIYKITKSPGVHDDAVETYKSWLEPKYRDYYVMTVPVLKQYGNLHTTRDWSVKSAWIRRSVIEGVLEVLMSIDGNAKLSEVAITRLFSHAYTVIAQGQMVKQNTPLTVQQSQFALMVLFCRAFMTKFTVGAVTAAIAPEARTSVAISEMGVLSLIHARVLAAGNGIVHKLLSGFSGVLREYNYSIEGRYDVQLPDFMKAVGYHEYHQVDSAAGMQHDWFPPGYGPGYGFSDHLISHAFGDDVVVRDLAFQNIEIDDIPPPKHSWVERMAAVTTFVRNQAAAVTAYDPEECDGIQLPAVSSVPVGGEQEPEVIKVAKLNLVKDELRRTPLMEMRCRHLDDAQGFTPEADELVRRVLDSAPTESTKVDVVYNSYLAPPLQLETSRGAVSATPLEDIRSALMMLFPHSLVMNTEYVEADRAYGEVSIIARTLRMKIDVSKIEFLKPEIAFKPVLRGHVLPHIKNNTVNTLATLAKRNADTPYQLTASGTDEKWAMVRKAMYEVYFVKDTEKFLSVQEPVAANERNIREWAVKQSAEKLRRLFDDKDFSIAEITQRTKKLHLMLKGKLKPEMDETYDSALRLPQSVQYDPTGKSVALLSPAFRDIVKREFYCYKPNVLVMQRKSLDDLVRFLNHFDHRTDVRGLPRQYIEIDETMFDKSQVREVAQLYLNYLKDMGLLPEYIELVAQMFNREVSSVKAGVQILLHDQNVSGAAFTLHRNNTVSMIIMALFLQRVLDKIEFIMMMGDDVTIAIRGDVDTATWEAELNRMFNMSAKITTQTHGYFCSTDIVHRYDGTTTVTRDVVKAMCSLMVQDHKDEDKFDEMFISFSDSFKYIQDLGTQQYLINALPKRWCKVLPTATPEAFRLLITGFAGILRGGKPAFRSFFSDEKFTKHY